MFSGAGGALAFLTDPDVGEDPASGGWEKGEEGGGSDDSLTSFAPHEFRLTSRPYGTPIAPSDIREMPHNSR